MRGSHPSNKGRPGTDARLGRRPDSRTRTAQHAREWAEGVVP